MRVNVCEAKEIGRGEVGDGAVAVAARALPNPWLGFLSAWAPFYRARGRGEYSIRGGWCGEVSLRVGFCVMTRRRVLMEGVGKAGVCEALGLSGLKSARVCCVVLGYESFGTHAFTLADERMG